MNINLLKSILLEPSYEMRRNAVQSKPIKGIYGTLKGNTLTYIDELSIVRTIDLKTETKVK